MHRGKMFTMVTGGGEGTCVPPQEQLVYWALPPKAISGSFIPVWYSIT